jgi:hypothetical protein
MLIDSTRATLLVVDIQEKLIGAMSDPAGTEARARWLLAATADLALPTVISEQYPKGLGHTLESRGCRRRHRRRPTFPASPPTACRPACWAVSR